MHSWADDVEPTDIYVVSCGDYSSMQVQAAFINEDAARAYVIEMNLREDCTLDHWDYERIDLNPPLPSVVRTMAGVPEPEPMRPEPPGWTHEQTQELRRVEIDSIFTEHGVIACTTEGCGQV